MTKRLAYASIAVALSLVASAAQVAATEIEPAEGSPEAAGFVFCMLAKPDIGKGLLYIFTPPFAQLVDDALRRSDEIQAAKPDERPPLGDGIPYQSFPDGSPVCEVGAVSDVGALKHVEILHRFPETPSAGWTDKLVLADWRGRLMIDDILYGAQNYKYGLRKVAEDVLKQ